tara:strand:- start:216 stop:443 length:228 start_codon:yes stop_codon:yes gene_type:complete
MKCIADAPSIIGICLKVCRIFLYSFILFSTTSKTKSSVSRFEKSIVIKNSDLTLSGDGCLLSWRIRLSLPSFVIE